MTFAPIRPTRRTPTRRLRSRAGAFTLIETAMALVIIGVGVIAMVDAQQAFIRSNAWSSQIATATFLANEIREMTRFLPRHDPVNGLELGGGGVIGWGPETGELGANDYDDLDDFDGVQFGDGGDLGGPINAFGEVITDINLDGSPMLDANGDPVPMRGWSQIVFVEKIDPFNTGTSLADDWTDPPLGSFVGREVDQFPLRVTVVVSYRPIGAATADEVTRVSWIVP